MFEAAVDGFDGNVGRVGMVEVDKHIPSSVRKRLAQRMG